MARKDILHKDGSATIENGDFKFGLSDAQHVDDIIFSKPGHYRQSPLTGFYIPRFLKAVETPQLRQQFVREFRDQLQADGYKATIDISAGLKDFKAKYE